ncbi:hypothetical protein RR42_s2075 [Cupriavidus basilensis]|uniref:Uncharacterized protein n=1 Tax=Cupriavidus basilensis TaxID=68895 RepID=A0A0C4YKT4_9BURK|nr:hypothetical protein RR42_s2075 [Cupriavidus basilensis]
MAPAGLKDGSHHKAACRPGVRLCPFRAPPAHAIAIAIAIAIDDRQAREMVLR